MIILLIIYFVSALIVNTFYNFQLENDFITFKHLLSIGMISTDEYFTFIEEDTYKIGQFVPILNTFIALCVILIFLLPNDIQRLD